MEGKREEKDSVLLEGFVFRRDGGMKPLPENETTASSSTCIRVPFRVSLGLVPLPDASRFYLEWPGGPNPDDTIPCHLVAAHRDCILFRLVSIVRSKTHPQYLIFPDDYYIYRPAAADLKRLPTCIRAKPVAAEKDTAEKDKLDLMMSQSEWSESESESEPFVVTKEMEWAEKKIREGYEKRLAMGVDVDEEVVRSSLVMENIGFLCREGGGEFIVAELLLNMCKRKVSAEVSLLHSSTCEWVHMRPLPIQCNNKYDSAALHCFCSQSAVPFGDSLCWFDHRNGIIIGRNMLEQTPKLSYITLPRRRPNRLEDDFRSVCAADGGSSLKFIDVVPDVQPPRSNGFTIVIYKLITTEDGFLKWEKEASMTSAEMWGLKSSQCIPHEVPMFPLIVSLDKPEIVHFRLSECTDYIDTVTLVSIDMRARSVVSVLTHIKGEQELHGEDADVAQARTLLPLRFLPAMFSKALISRPVNLRKRKDQS